MWRRVVLAWTDVLEERIASIFRVEKSASEEPVWAGGCRLQTADVLPKRRFTQDLQGATSQKMDIDPAWAPKRSWNTDYLLYGDSLGERPKIKRNISYNLNAMRVKFLPHWHRSDFQNVNNRKKLPRKPYDCMCVNKQTSTYTHPVRNGSFGVELTYTSSISMPNI
jgi:hypothetical protein